MGEIITISDPDHQRYARLCTLISGLKLEGKGLHRRGRSCLSILKSEYKFKGNRDRVMEQAVALRDRMLGEQYLEISDGRLRHWFRAIASAIYADVRQSAKHAGDAFVTHRLMREVIGDGLSDVNADDPNKCIFAYYGGDDDAARFFARQQRPVQDAILDAMFPNGENEWH